MNSIEVVPFIPESDSQYWRQAYDLIKREIFAGDGDFPGFCAQTQIMQQQCGPLYGIVPEHRTSLAAVGVLGVGSLDGYREVAYLATEQRSRRHGYGRYLLGLLERIAEDEGAIGTYLAPSGEALNFYRKHQYGEWKTALTENYVLRKQFSGTLWAK